MELNDPVSKIKFVSNAYELKLAKLGIVKVKDLLTHFPRAYNDASDVILIKDLVNSDLEEKLTFNLTVLDYKNTYLRGRMSIQRVNFSDDSGTIDATFFNQVYLSRVFIPGKNFLVQGKVKIVNSKKYGTRYVLYPLNYEENSQERETVHLGRISPEYRLTSGITKKWFRNRVKSIVDEVQNGYLSVPNELTNLFNINDALKEVHFPENFENLEKAKNDLAKLELVSVYLKVFETNSKKVKLAAPKLSTNLENLKDEFKKLIPFSLTTDQNKIIDDLASKLAKGHLLNELVQGDVGSGKTVIIMFLCYVIAKSDYQAAVLAPTTILARQHFESFTKCFENTKLKIELVSSENKKNSKADIFIGTTALLKRKKDLITNLGILIADEQHRFGVEQREELVKDLGLHSTHFVNVTATPIPRTITETFFSDLEVSILKSKPKDRLPIKSFLVPEEKRTDSYMWIRDQVLKGDQAYWVTPLVEESETLDIKSVKETFKHIKENLKGLNVELLHGKMKVSEKSEIMSNFKAGKIHILVSTTVIEVGVDVANATIMVIENAERFGLAQLHQIRGRVGRGSKQSYFFMFAGEDINEQSKMRLEFMSKNDDGLKVAEFDLKTRGPGEVYGTKQSGIPDLKIATLGDLELLKESKDIARELFNKQVKTIEIFN